VTVIRLERRKIYKKDLKRRYQEISLNRGFVIKFVVFNIYVTVESLFIKEIIIIAVILLLVGI